MTLLEKGAPAKYSGRNQRHQQKLYYRPKPTLREEEQEPWSAVAVKLNQETVHTHTNTVTLFFKNFFVSYLYPWYIHSLPHWLPTILPMPMQLARDNSQPMGFGSGQGLQARTGTPVHSSAQGHSVEEGPSAHRVAAVQGSNKGCLLLCQPVPQPDNCCWEGRLTQASDQSEAIEPVHEGHPLQDGELRYMMKDILRKGNWMASIDLKDAYLSVAVWEGHRRYFHFMWQDTIYEFQPLPFGLHSTPRGFTKLLKPVLAQLRQKGACVIMYLDDTLVMTQSRDELERQLGQTTSLLERLGFVINRKKYQLQPTLTIQFLGFLVDSQKMPIRLTEERVVQITTAYRRVQQAASLITPPTGQANR